MKRCSLVLISCMIILSLSSSVELADTEFTSIEEFGRHAGYYVLPHTKGARMFYYLFESKNNSADDPIVVWLTGGPGCSGSIALFYENGPYHLTDNLSLASNEFSWNKETNLIYVDQPTGTGFSYSSSREDIRSTSDEAAFDFYNFLQAFLEEHPDFLKNEFYITGESYAGHYIPAFAALIHRKNINNEGIHINLKGLAIGDGWTDPGIQSASYPDYALQEKLINETQYSELVEAVEECSRKVEACNTWSSSVCRGRQYLPQHLLPNREIKPWSKRTYYYDIRKPCQGSDNQCYDLSSLDKFLNQSSVRQALGVGNIQFSRCSDSVREAMAGDWVKDYAPDIAELLEQGIKVLIYAGEYDLICTWLGNSRWVEKMVWWGQGGYMSAPWVPFTVDGVEAGQERSHGGLSFLKVYNAGHLVPMDHPKFSLQMLNRWIQTNPARPSNA